MTFEMSRALPQWVVDGYLSSTNQYNSHMSYWPEVDDTEDYYGG